MTTAYIQSLRNTVTINQSEGRSSYDGMTSDEISDYNRWLMFGDDAIDDFAEVDDVLVPLGPGARML